MGCLTAPSDGSIGQAIKRPSVTEIRVVTHYPLNPFWRVRYTRVHLPGVVSRLTT